MNKIKELKIFDYHFIYLFFLMILGGVFGFCLENVSTCVALGFIDSRFQRLPCILGYGIVVVLLYIIFGTPDNMRLFNIKLFEKRKHKATKHILYFLVVTGFIFVAEFGAGELFELLTGAVLWNYSNVPLHLGKYVCLPFTIGFGTLAYVLMGYIFCPLMNTLEKKVSPDVVIAIDCFFGIPVVIDFCITTVLLAIGKAPTIIWKVILPWYNQRHGIKTALKLALSI